MENTDDIKSFIVNEELQNSRIDFALSLIFPEISRNFTQKLIANGNVTIDKTVCLSKKEKLIKGQVIEITLPPMEKLEVVPQDIPLDIVYEDDDILIVNKPKGMVVHPAAGNHDGTLVNAVMHHCGDSLSAINGIIRPGIVHRIDKDTSGLLMIAKNDTAHASLAAQLEEHSITRVYHALVYNNIKEDEGIIDIPIGRDRNNRLKQAVFPYVNGIVPKGARRAVTHYDVLERLGKYTYIEARLETGRTHQIRVHMAYMKHPLVGDIVYGPKKAISGAEGQMLHAKVIGFVHPRTGKYMEFDSPLPQDFILLLEKMRKSQ